MTLWDIYSLIGIITNKDFSGNIVTPGKFNELIKVANIDLFRKKYGLPEEYKPGRPVPNEYVDVTLKNMDDLRRKFHKTIINTPVADGVLPYPLDYAHRDTIRYNYTKSINGEDVVLPKEVEILRGAQMSERLGNYTKRPTTKNSCGELRLDGIYIYPTTINVVDFHYFRFPNNPEFAYTISDGYAVYNPSASTELEWPVDEHITLTRMVLQYVGVNLRESDIVQYSELKLREG